MISSKAACPVEIQSEANLDTCARLVLSLTWSHKGDQRSSPAYKEDRRQLTADAQSLALVRIEGSNTLSTEGGQGVHFGSGEGRLLRLSFYLLLSHFWDKAAHALYSKFAIERGDKTYGLLWSRLRVGSMSRREAQQIPRSFCCVARSCTQEV